MPDILHTPSLHTQTPHCSILHVPSLVYHRYSPYHVPSVTLCSHHHTEHTVATHTHRTHHALPPHTFTHIAYTLCYFTFGLHTPHHIHTAIHVPYTHPHYIPFKTCHTHTTTHTFHTTHTPTWTPHTHTHTHHTRVPPFTHIFHYTCPHTPFPHTPFALRTGHAFVGSIPACNHLEPHLAMPHTTHTLSHIRSYLHITHPAFAHTLVLLVARTPSHPGHCATHGSHTPLPPHIHTVPCTCHCSLLVVAFTALPGCCTPATVGSWFCPQFILPYCCICLVPLLNHAHARLIYTHICLPHTLHGVPVYTLPTHIVHIVHTQRCITHTHSQAGPTMCLPPSACPAFLLWPRFCALRLQHPRTHTGLVGARFALLHAHHWLLPAFALRYVSLCCISFIVSRR